MIPHTKAFRVLKGEAQQVFDFAIVVAYAVPSLKKALATLQPGETLPFTPDYFDATRIPTAKVRHNAAHYKELLSRQIFLSSFSFFEAYFHDVLKEIVQFHGGEALLEKVSIAPNLNPASSDAKRWKRKLQEYRTSSNLDGYVTYGRKLAGSGFRFPSELLARFGLRKLLDLVKGDYIRAIEIPILVEEILQLRLDPQSEVAAFQNYRKIRNRIAHGRASGASLHLKKAVEANNFLRNLALKIDKHVVEHYLIVESV